MKTLSKTQDKFLPGDVVKIIKGDLKNKIGSIITLTARDPKSKYLVELGDGTDVMIEEASLQKIE